MLQGLLPFLEKDLNLYSNKKSLEISLQTVFEGYIEFCLVIIRHLAKNPFCTYPSFSNRVFVTTY